MKYETLITQYENLTMERKPSGVSTFDENMELLRI